MVQCQHIEAQELPLSGMKQPSERQEQQKKHQLVTPKAIPKHEEFMNRPNCDDPIFSHKQMKQTNSLNHPASDFP